MKRNIAYKADGTEETGKKIIDALINLGGKNTSQYVAISETRFFFIDNDGIIDMSKKLPFCYDLKSIDECCELQTSIDRLTEQIKELIEKL